MIAAKGLPTGSMGFTLTDRFDEYEQMAMDLAKAHANDHSDIDAAADSLIDVFMDAYADAQKFALTTDVDVNMDAVHEAAQALALPPEEIVPFSRDCSKTLADWKDQSEEQARVPIVGKRYSYIFVENDVLDQLRPITQKMDIPFYAVALGSEAMREHNAPDQVIDRDWLESGNDRTMSQEWLPRRIDPDDVRFERTLGLHGRLEQLDTEFAKQIEEGTMDRPLTTREFHAILFNEGEAVTDYLHYLEGHLDKPMDVSEITEQRQMEDGLELKECYDTLKEWAQQPVENRREIPEKVAAAQEKADFLCARMEYRQEALKFASPAVRFTTLKRNQDIRDAAKDVKPPQMMLMLRSEHAKQLETALVNDPDPNMRTMLSKMSEAAEMCFEDENSMRRQCPETMKVLDEMVGFGDTGYQSNYQVRNQLDFQRMRHIQENLYRTLIPGGFEIQRDVSAKGRITLALDGYLKENFPDVRIEPETVTKARIAHAQLSALDPSHPELKPTEPVQTPKAQQQTVQPVQTHKAPQQKVQQAQTPKAEEQPKPGTRQAQAEPTVLEAAAGESAAQEARQVQEQKEEAIRQAELEAQRQSKEPSVVDQVIEAGAMAALGMAHTALTVAAMEKTPMQTAPENGGPTAEEFEYMRSTGLRRGIQHYKDLLRVAGATPDQRAYNTALIYQQKPDASVLRTRDQWARLGFTPNADADAVAIRVQTPTGPGTEVLYDVSEVQGQKGELPVRPETLHILELGHALNVNLESRNLSPAEIAPYRITDACAVQMGFSRFGKDRTPEQEFMARSAAYAVCTHFGIEADRGPWAKNSDLLFAPDKAMAFYQANNTSKTFTQIVDAAGAAIRGAEAKLAPRHPERMRFISPKAMQRAQQTQQRAQAGPVRAPQRTSPVQHKEKARAMQAMARDAR